MPGNQPSDIFICITTLISAADATKISVSLFQMHAGQFRYQSDSHWSKDSRSRLEKSREATSSARFGEQGVHWEQNFHVVAIVGLANAQLLGLAALALRCS